MYYDGVNKSTSPTSVVPDSGSMERFVLGGGEYGSVAQTSDIVIAHWASWNVEFSADDAESLVNGASPLSVRRDNLKAYWPLNSPSNLIDVSSNNFDLTMDGTGATQTDEGHLLSRHILHG